MNTPCETLLGKSLPGSKKTGFWKITEKIERRLDGTGGTFSVCYLAEHDDGTKAFVKATDIGLLTRFQSEDALSKMEKAINEQNFERKILDICRGNNLDRIVHAIDYGQIETVFNGVKDIIFYIMFERANGDVRAQMSREQRASTSWCLCAMHNLSVAIQQLHRESIAHNDIKPSNFLIFDQYLQKLADLGRATSDITSGPWDKIPYSGDFDYAAPEFWYRSEKPSSEYKKVPFPVRRASDLFHLGSMGFFLMTGEKLSPLMRTYLRPEHNSLNWRGSFEDVLPFLRDAFGKSMSLFDQELPRDRKENLLQESIAFRTAVMQLCEVDPHRRGHPLNAAGNQDPYALDRFISIFDSNRKTLRMKELMA